MSISFTEANQWGFFDVVIKGFGTIKGCKYVASHDFIALPSRKAFDKDGNAKKTKTGKDMYLSDVSLEKEFEAKILAAYHAANGQASDGDIPF